MGYNNIYAPVQHLTKAEIRPGGFCYAVFAKWENVLIWPVVDPVTGLCYTGIVLKDGATWYKLNVANNQNFYTEESKKDSAGSSVAIKISGYLGGNKISHILGSQAMNYGLFVAIVKDRDGTTYLIGDEDSGASFNFNFSNGDFSSSRKRLVEFNWESQNGAVVYLGGDPAQDDAVINPPFQNDGDFSGDFSDDFNN